MPAPKNAPLYQQIYDEIKDAIEKGVYAPKERIPSELELAEQYEVSRITVRRAVEELCSDGYLVKQQGRGTFVSTPHINRQFHASTLQTFTALCAGNGMKAGAHVIDRQIVPARQNEMEFFGLQKDALLLHIKRVRTADGEPIFEENIFVPFDAYRELLTADLEDKSIFAEVERVGGTPIVSVGYRTVEAVRANTEQAAELIGNYEIVKAPIALKALPYCNICCLTGDELKDCLGGYLSALYEMNPQSVGGKLPDDGLYYAAEK